MSGRIWTDIMVVVGLLAMAGAQGVGASSQPAPRPVTILYAPTSPSQTAFATASAPHALPHRKPPPRPEPADSRKNSAMRIESLLTGGKFAPDALARQLQQSCTGLLPAATQTRQDLVQALGQVLAGKTVKSADATPISRALAAAANADGLSAEQIRAIRTRLGQALKSEGASAGQLERVDQAMALAIEQQQDPRLLAVSGGLERLWTDRSSASAPTSAPAERLTRDLQTLARADTPAARRAIAAATDLLAAALADKLLLNLEQAQLVHDLKWLLTGEPIPPAGEDTDRLAAARDAQTVLESAGVPPNQARDIMAAFAAVAPAPKPSSSPAASPAQSRP